MDPRCVARGRHASFCAITLTVACACVQYLTLVFIGFISASSMRGFLKDMRRVRVHLGLPPFK